MSKTKLKKSNVKKKSSRSVEMAAAKEAEEKQEQAEKAEQKKKQNAVVSSFANAAFPMYSLVAAIFSFLLNRIGVFSAVGIILGIFGLRKNKSPKNKFYWISFISIVISVLTGILFILSLFGLAQSVS